MNASNQASVNRQIWLVSRPAAEPSHDNFRLVQTPLEPLAPGQVRVRNHYLSVDPYMRGHAFIGLLKGRNSGKQLVKLV
ncbi:hypothetical protein KQH60_07515 [Mycetohabitans sp. B8]|nr:hypothetical protein [Mycetohabitans sp. B8]